MEHPPKNLGVDHEIGLKSYLTGFILAIALTVIPFWLVAVGTRPRIVPLMGIFGCAILQILVHLYYFLHLNTSIGQRWNVLAIVFTALIIVIMLGGTLWVMVNLNYHMMPR